MNNASTIKLTNNTQRLDDQARKTQKTRIQRRDAGFELY